MAYVTEIDFTDIGGNAVVTAIYNTGEASLFTCEHLGHKIILTTYISGTRHRFELLNKEYWILTKNGKLNPEKLVTGWYYDEKWDTILTDIQKDEMHGKLTDWERKFVSTCLNMWDKRIALSPKQRPILERIYNELGERK